MLAECKMKTNIGVGVGVSSPVKETVSKENFRLVESPGLSFPPLFGLMGVYLLPGKHKPV